MTYIVYWILIVYTTIHCPNNKVDEFGRSNSASCTVQHGRKGFVFKSKEFNSREKAFEFYNKCKMQPDIDSVDIDSTSTKFDN